LLETGGKADVAVTDIGSAEVRLMAEVAVIITDEVLAANEESPVPVALTLAKVLLVPFSGKLDVLLEKVGAVSEAQYPFQSAT